MRYPRRQSSDSSDSSDSSGRLARHSDAAVVMKRGEEIPRQSPSCDHAVTSLRNAADCIGNAYLGPLDAFCRAERSK